MQPTPELDLANGFRVVANGPAEEPDVYHLCQTLAQQLKPFVDRYGGRRHPRSLTEHSAERLPVFREDNIIRWWKST